MPKELAKHELVPWGWAPGTYMMKCRDCGDQPHDADKRAFRCERCAMIARYTQAEQKVADLAYLTA